MRLLVIEDDEALANLIVRCLKDESYAVDRASDGQEGEWLAFENPYDLIILDIMLPRKNGIAVLESLREAKIKTPVLFLTAKDSVEDRVKGLDRGGDDYLTKPFSVEEFLARVRALLRRRHEDLLPTIIEIGPIHINPSRKEVLLAGQRVDLTSKEYALLEYFARNVGTVLSRTQLSEHVWDLNFEPTSNVVDVYVGYLRSKFTKALGHSMIRTVRGHGYILDPEPEDLPTDASYHELEAQP